MSAGATPEDIARLLAVMNLEIEPVPNNLKCPQCKSVLKDACQLRCGCRFCRACLDAVMASGGQFCPGSSEECGETPLSASAPDFRANKRVSKLTVKCPLAGCSHKCPLADMETHLRACPRQTVDCPFREFGCQKDKLPADEIGEHLRQESRSHSEILVAMVTNMNRNIEMLKHELVLKDEHVKTVMDQMRHVENENKSIKDEIKSIRDENKLIKNEIKSIEDENKSTKNENKSIKNEIKSIKIEMKLIKDENKLIKSEMESIKLEKEVLPETVLEVTLETDESDDGGGQDDVVGTTLVAASRVVGLRMRGRGRRVRYSPRSIRGVNRSIYDTDSMTSEAPLELGQVDASCNEWLIDEDVANTGWGSQTGSNKKRSAFFTGTRLPYMFQLVSINLVRRRQLCVRILVGPSDSGLEWPFVGAVTVTIADRERREARIAQTRQCRIGTPRDNQCNSSDAPVSAQPGSETAGPDLVRADDVLVPYRESHDRCTVCTAPEPEQYHGYYSPVGFTTRARGRVVGRWGTVPADRNRDNALFVFPHLELELAGLDLAHGVHVSCQIVPGGGQ